MPVKKPNLLDKVNEISKIQSEKKETILKNKLPQEKKLKTVKKTYLVDSDLGNFIENYCQEKYITQSSATARMWKKLKDLTEKGEDIPFL